MGNFKDIQVLEQLLFDTIEYLEKELKVAVKHPTAKIRYQSGLAALDLLNEEYRGLTGKFYIDLDRVLRYHSMQWEKYS